MRVSAFAGMLVGCAGSDAGPTTTPDTGTVGTAGACGEVSEIVMTITGTVEDAAGAPIGGAQIVLEERNWRPGTIHGTASAEVTGAFSLPATGLPVVEGCWGTAVSYWLVGTSGALSGDKPMNPTIMAAWEDGASAADLGSFPLILR